MAILKVDRIEKQRSILVFKDQLVLYNTIPTNVKVSWIADSSSAVRVRLDGSGLEHITETSYFRLVTSDDKADVVISLHTNQGRHSLKVKRFDPLILQLGGTRRVQDFDEVCLDDVVDIPATVDHIARFHYYLGWSTSPKERRIEALSPPDDIKFRLYKLVTRNGIREPQDSNDRFSGRSVDTRFESFYGIEISKDTDGCVYLSLFSFDPQTYKIEVSITFVNRIRSLVTSTVWNLMTRMIVSLVFPTADPKPTPLPSPALQTVAMSSLLVMVRVVGILLNSNPMNAVFSNFLPPALTVT